MPGLAGRGAVPCSLVQPVLEVPDLHNVGGIQGATEDVDLISHEVTIHATLGARR